MPSVAGKCSRTASAVRCQSWSGGSGGSPGRGSVTGCSGSDAAAAGTGSGHTCVGRHVLKSSLEVQIIRLDVRGRFLERRPVPSTSTAARSACSDESWTMSRWVGCRSSQGRGFESRPAHQGILFYFPSVGGDLGLVSPRLRRPPAQNRPQVLVSPQGTSGTSGRILGRQPAFSAPRIFEPIGCYLASLGPCFDGAASSALPAWVPERLRLRHQIDLTTRGSGRPRVAPGAHGPTRRIPLGGLQRGVARQDRYAFRRQNCSTPTRTSMRTPIAWAFG